MSPWSDPTTVPAVCNVCQGSLRQARVHAVPSDNRARRGTMFRLVRCPGCRTIHGLDAEPVSKNAPDYSLGRQNPSYFNRRVNQRTLRFMMKKLHLRPSDLFLAYGMRNELVANYFSRHVRNFFAYDPYFPKYDDKAFIFRQRYDIVLMENVFGQTDDPRAVFREAHGLLNKGGLLCLNAPDADQIDLTRPEDYVLEIHAPYRVHLFSPETLIRFGTDAGFDLVRRENGRAFSDTWSPFVNWRFMKKFARARDNTLDALFDGRDRLKTIWRHPALLVAGLLGGFYRSGTEVVYVFKKKTDANCPLCASANQTFVYDQTFEKMELIQCRDCGGVFLDSRGTGAPQVNTRPRPFDGFWWWDAARQYFRSRYLSRRVGPRSRVFEIGCGQGQMLRAMSRRGHETYGMETADIREDGRPFLAFSQGTKGTTADPGTDFHLVCLTNVLQKSKEPSALVRKAHALLRPGGLLVVETPNYGSPAARFFGRSWSLLNLPLHVFQFNQRSLVGWIEGHGFHVKEVYARAEVGDAWDWAQSLLNAMFAPYGTQPAVSLEAVPGGSILSRTIDRCFACLFLIPLRGLLAMTLSLPCLFFRWAGGKGSRLRVVAERDSTALRS